ncbi:rhamnogalacturonan lyase family protein [Botrimarina mediterranea]|nr:hypothetical protein [Botrimarina mediterranea]
MERSRKARLARLLSFDALEPRAMLAVTTLVAAADSFTAAGVGAGSAPVLDALDANGSGDRAVYVRFDLSTVDLSEVTSATFKLFKTGGTRNDTIVTERFDVYGLLPLAGNTPQNWNEATLAEGGVGAEYTNTSGNGPDVSRLFSLDAEAGAAVTETVINADGAAQSITGPDLLAFLQARKADSGLATFVTYVDAGAVRGWGYSSREATDVAVRPVLELDGAVVVDPVDPEDSYPEDPVAFPRQVERLDRGVVAVRPAEGSAYIGWRLLGDDPTDVAFNVYRASGGGEPEKINRAPVTQTTDFRDNSATAGVEHTYFVRAVVDGEELAASESYTLDAATPVQQHLDIPLQIPPDGMTPSGDTYSYNANDASVGDLDGDGQYEIILKWDPSNAKDNSQSGYTGNVYVDAYTLEGELLWRIDLGRNIRAGAHYTQLAVYDFDGDGRSEVILKTAPGTIDGEGNPVLMRGYTADADYRNASGYVITGPEFLTVFDGQTGGALSTIHFEPARGSASQWGDSYGNRVDRFTVGVAYLDGERPSLIFGRGYYGPQGGFQARNEVAAYDFRDGQLTERWIFKAATNGPNPEYIGEGAHSLTIGDVDGDGYDEVVYGASAIDHDGTGLYATGLGHGDALHMSDMDPTRPGLEVFMVHESRGAYESNGRDAGGELRDAMTGELLFQIPSNDDVGRGVAMDIDPNHLGYEFWATTNEGTRMIYNVSGEALYPASGGIPYNFGVWWDADLSRELLDGTTISKWNSPGRTSLVSSNSNGINDSSGLSSNNGSKSTPTLSGDLFGDWREEVIWRRSDNSALEIWTTTISATSRLTTLMHDTQYRVAIAWQNGAYNQPPHPSFYLGTGMETPPRPLLYFGGELRGDFNADGAVNAADYTVWRDNLGSTTNLAADADRNGVVEEADRSIWLANYGAVAAAPATEEATAPAAMVSRPTVVDSVGDELTPPPFAFVIDSGLDTTAEARPVYRPATRVASPGQLDQRDLLLVRQSYFEGASDLTERDSKIASSTGADVEAPADFDGAFERLGRPFDE